VTGAARQRQEAGRRFRESFGYDPSAVAAAPGRINVIGEHTDYSDGWVLPAAVNRYVAVAAAPSPTGATQVVSDRSPGLLQRPTLSARRGDWVDYVSGVLSLLNVSTGLDLAITGDIPDGAGLGSSAALEVATATAALALSGTDQDGRILARLCRRVENEFVGVRTGIMDPMTALFGRAGSALLLDCRSLDFAPVPLPGGEYAFLLADTRVKHTLATSAYNQRRAECERAAAALGVAALRDASEPDLSRLGDPVLARRARHVVTENARVLRAAALLRAGDVAGLGPLLDASHQSLKNDFSVSVPELDHLVELAESAPVVAGARMMGGGFGGCVLILLRAGSEPDVEGILRMGYVRRFNREPAFYRVRSVDGTLAGTD